MFGLLGLLGALVAGLSLDAMMQEPSSEEDADDASEAEDQAWGVSTEFMEAPEQHETSDHGGTEPDGQPKSDDLPDPADPDLVLSGSSESDLLEGGSGHDQISAGAGNDFLEGNAGEDSLSGGTGDDHASGGAGADWLAGGDGDDSLRGDEGNDVLTGEAGNDDLAGGEGDDRVSAGEGDDSAMGGTGDDWLVGGAGADTLLGGEGGDIVLGGDGADEVDGGAGNDTLWGSSGGEDDGSTDFVNGGEGDDALHLGAGDYGNGGAGADNFALQDFAPGSTPVQISDFDPAEDRLVVMYDAALHPDPQLTLQSGGGVTVLLLDGVPLASLTNGAALDLNAVLLQAA